MSRGLFSGAVWLLCSILICGGVLRATHKEGEDIGTSSGKITIIIFDVCIIGGILLGLMPILPGIMLFIGFCLFTGYVLFFQKAGV